MQNHRRRSADPRQTSWAAHRCHIGWFGAAAMYAAPNTPPRPTTTAIRMAPAMFRRYGHAPAGAPPAVHRYPEATVPIISTKIPIVPMANAYSIVIIGSLGDARVSAAVMTTYGTTLTQSRTCHTIHQPLPNR